MTKHGACVLAVCVLAVWVSGASAQDLSQPGPYLAGWRTVTVVGPNNRQFTARLHYPALAAGQNAAINPAGAPYPAVSFGHGFFQAVSTYQSTLAHLATHGYLVIASESEGGLSPNHGLFAQDLSTCLTYLEQQNALPGSVLFGLVDVERFGLSGHSMGGGCSLVAAASDPRVDVVANLAAAETNVSAIGAMSAIACPVYLISGSSDTIVPVANNGQRMFAAGRAPKQLPIIQGAWHCGFQDTSFIFGCDSGPMPRAEQLAITRRLLTTYFNLHLKRDQSVWSAVWGPGLDDDVRVRVTLAAGVAVSPASQTVVARAGAAASIEVSVENTGVAANSYDVLVDGPAGFVAPLVAAGPIAPGAAAGVVVRLAVPAGLANQSRDVVVSARSRADGATRAWADARVNIVCTADYTLDGTVDINDFFRYLELFAQDDPDSDADGNGAVDINDFFAFLALLSSGC